MDNGEMPYDYSTVFAGIKGAYEEGEEMDEKGKRAVIWFAQQALPWLQRRWKPDDPRQDFAKTVKAVDIAAALYVMWRRGVRRGERRKKRRRLSGNDSDIAINSDDDIVKEKRFSNYEKSTMVKSVYKFSQRELEEMMKDADRWKVVANIIYKGNSKTYKFVPEERSPASSEGSEAGTTSGPDRKETGVVLEMMECTVIDFGED